MVAYVILNCEDNFVGFPSIIVTRSVLDGTSFLHRIITVPVSSKPT